MTTPQQPQQAPNNVAAKPAVLHATLTIKRKATGKVETYQIVGTPVPAKQQPKEPS